MVLVLAPAETPAAGRGRARITPPEELAGAWFFMRVPVAARARQPSSRYHAFRAILASKNHKAPQKPHHRYLDNFHTKRLQLPSIKDTGMMVFRDTMFPMVKNDLTTAIIDMVTLEREGGQIDRGLLKSVVDLFVEMGLGSMDTYRNGCASLDLEVLLM